MGESLDTLVGKKAADAAREMITASLDESAKAVAKSVGAYTTVWESKVDAERETLMGQATAWAIKQNGHRVQCPACRCNAVVTGHPIAAALRTIDGDDITEVQQYLPSKFECIACGLKISGLPQLSAVRLGSAYKATFMYDASDYYAAPEDASAGYEPDFNE